MRMEPSVFTKIINGEIPCHKVYEDDLIIAFMDINPLMQGHVLVVPKIQVDRFDDLPNDDYVALFKIVKKLSTLLRQEFQTKRTVMLALGYDVPHAHIHLIPSNESAPIYKGLNELGSSPQTEPNHDKLELLAERIKKHL